MVYQTISVPEFQRNTPIAVITFMFLDYVINHFSLLSIFVSPLIVFQMLVNRTASHLFELYQQTEVCMLVTP